jgi:predicted RNA-binding protein (virulence factor B family)
MLQLGEFNQLTIIRITDHGWFLEDEEQNEVLLPNRFVTEDMAAGDKIEVFLFKDSEDRITATTEKPLISLNEFALLKVKDVNKYGAFLDWGMDKDLMVPFSEQHTKMNVGEEHIVRLVHDEKTDRLFASARLNRYLEFDYLTVKPLQEVDIIITEETDIGFKAIIEDAHLGLIYKSDVFQALKKGDRMKAWIKLIREDGKIDLSLQKFGYSNIEPSAEKILAILKENEGFLPLHDKSTPQEIVDTLNMSKKTFKKSIGSLYKEKLIVLKDNGIQLV